MKACAVSFIVIIFLISGCRKESNKTDAISDIGNANFFDTSNTITSNKWVFTEYHDKVSFQSQPDPSHSYSSTYSMAIISGGDETARISSDGKIYLARNYDFNFANAGYFNGSLQPSSYVTSSYTALYYDTVNYNLVNKSVIISKPTRYLPDTMLIKYVDTACLALSGMLHVNGYDVNRTIVLYKNTRWYGGSKSFQF